MQVTAHNAGHHRLAEISGVKLAGANDLMTMMLHARIHRCDGIIVDELFVAAEFFRLENGLARQVLQRLADHRFRLAIVGDISRYTQNSEALRTLVRDANRGTDIRFATTVGEVLAVVQNWPA